MSTSGLPRGQKVKWPRWVAEIQPTSDAVEANTAKKRTHSLYRQGIHYYNAIPMMRSEKLVPLVDKFAELVRGQAICIEIIGLI